MVHDNINTSDYCAFCTFALQAFGGDIFTNEQVSHQCYPLVLLTILPSPPGTACSDLQDPVNVGEQLILADEVQGAGGR
jgi:hypothetical protein